MGIAGIAGAIFAAGACAVAGYRALKFANKVLELHEQTSMDAEAYGPELRTQPIPAQLANLSKVLSEDAGPTVTPAGNPAKKERHDPSEVESRQAARKLDD